MKTRACLGKGYKHCVQMLSISVYRMWQTVHVYHFGFTKNTIDTTKMCSYHNILPKPIAAFPHNH